MKLFGGVVSITGFTFLMFVLFAIVVLGYLLGRITIKGVSLGTAGVFIVALLFGALFNTQLGQTVTQTISGEAVSVSSSALKVIEQLGLLLFVGSVGLIAGPNFFSNFKKNFKSYIVLGIVIILAGALTCVGCFYIGRGAEESDTGFIAMLVGILSGSLTSTPAFSAAKATVATVAADATAAAELEDMVTVGHGIAYLFGVIGVVLFVQIVPKILGADMDAERKKIVVVDTSEKKKKTGKFNIDPFGLAAFGLTVVIGVFVGAIKIPLSGDGLSGLTFSLTSTGGVLLAGLVVGHFGHIGPFNLKVNEEMLKIFREFGLVLFLLGAGIPGGANFVNYFKGVYFLYGIAMTLIPMLIGFFFAKFVLKLPLLNNLGSITGGMTSTPALGTLISSTKSDDVASAYASTYPVALIAVVLASQFLILIFG